MNGSYSCVLSGSVFKHVMALITTCLFQAFSTITIAHEACTLFVSVCWEWDVYRGKLFMKPLMANVGGGEREQLGVWTAEGGDFIKVFV